MSSLISRLKSGNTPRTSPIGFSPGKKLAPPPPLTPLEKLLEDTGPLKNDGNDKFFGMHNASNTCYCNSVVQCLYYSEPFREHMINWPRKGQAHSAAEPDPNIGQFNAPNSSTPLKTPVIERTDPFAPKKPGASTGPTSPAGSQPENKETFDYQKKLAMQGGPHLRMERGFYDNYDMPESLFTSLKDLFEAITTHGARKGIITPTKLLELVRQNVLFQGNTHQDAHEFLKVLLDEVVDQVEKYSKAVANDTEKQQGLGLSIPNGDQPTEEKAKAASSWVHELFEGTLTSETRCLTCENISQRDEAFLDLSIDLEAHSSVTSCLRKFSEEEMLCERNKFHCDKCSGLQEAEKRMKIKRLPRILALHLKRFEYNEDYTMLHKLFHRVVYPFHLRIFNTTDDVEDPDRLYELYAVIVHLGTTPFHGHYVSIIKTKELGWLLFDDELVVPVDKNYVRNFFGGTTRIGNETRNSPACAYVLFYQQTTEEAVQREQEAEDDVRDVPIAVNFDSQGIIASSGPEADGMLSPIIPPTPASEEANPFSVPMEHAYTSPDAPPELEAIDEEGQPLQRSPSTEQSKGFGMGRFGSMKKKNTMDHLRSTSFTMRSKPKFWGSSKAEAPSETEPSANFSVAPSVQTPLSPPSTSEQDGPEKEKKSRFSLGRKKSKLGS